MLAPLVVPLVVLGTAMLLLFNYIGIPFGPITLIIAHVIIALPFAILTLTPRLERIPVAFEEASRDLGASGVDDVPRRSRSRSSMPAVVSAFLIVYVISFDEIVLASFLAGHDDDVPLVRVLAAAAAAPAAADPGRRRDRAAGLDDPRRRSAEVLRARSDRLLGEGQTPRRRGRRRGGARDGARPGRGRRERGTGDHAAGRQQDLRRRRRGRRRLARDRRGRVHHAARPLGLRQDHHDADDRGLRGADRRHGSSCAATTWSAPRRTSAR